MANVKTTTRELIPIGLKAAHNNNRHDCSKLKYKRTLQEEIDPSNKENIPDNCQSHRQHNLKCIPANIDGLDVSCHLDPSMEANLLREDLWQKIARAGLSSSTLGINRQARLKSNFGYDIYPLGNVILHCSIRGEICNIEWTVVPDYSIPVEACLGLRLPNPQPSRINGERVLQPKKISNRI